MKTINNITLYQCEWCNKKLFRKWAMENHELKCSLNPSNDRPCLHCFHLEQREIEYENQNTYSNNDFSKGNTFFCNHFKKFMLHPKIIHSKYVENLKQVYFNDEEVIQEEMPMTCEIFNNQSIDIFNL